MDYDSFIQAGFASADITPRGGPISLIGQWNERVSDVVRDPILANAMVLKKDGAPVIWVACDICAIAQSLTDEVKRLLQTSLTGFDGDRLVLSATHIHTGPNINIDPFTALLDGRDDPPGSIPTVECIRQVALGIEKAVLTAVKNLEPSIFEIAVSYTITGTSRRASYFDGTGVMYGDVKRPDFAGMEGRDGGPMQILYVRRALDNALAGVVAAVPCTAQADEMGHYVTADYWATARDVIKQGLGDGVVILGLIRSAGDLSPHTMVDGGKLIERLGGEKGAVDMGKRVGTAVVIAAGDVLAAYGADAAFDYASLRDTLPLWTADKDEYDAAKLFVADGGKGGLGPLKDMMAYSTAFTRIKRYELGQAEYPVDFHALRVGDIAFITNPFEMYIEYADRIRAACPEAQVIDVQLAGDDCLGYLATQKAIDAGGYSTMIFSCYFDAKGGEMAVEKSIALIKELFG